ncbi:MAG TPA: hypothetical protein VK689_12145 [Armatimonadota bacterium]|jgi:hypothetical protein|nr:hypothetical protein [Armatimonadota bacterium]
MRKALAGFFALALCSAAPAFAQDAPPAIPTPTPVVEPVTEARVPNFLGATGLLYAPSAYTQGNRVVTPYIAGNSDFFGGGVVGGIGDRFEVGLSVLDFDNNLGGDTEFFLNAKFNFLRETDKYPALAAGVIDALDSTDQGQSWYVMASKYFTRTEIEQRFAVKGHLGFGGGLYDEEIIAGAEFFFGRNLSLMAEYVNSDFDFGARYTHRGFAATLGWFDTKHIGGQLSYTVRF